MKKFFFKLHLWLSVPIGLIITLICFSGAMLVFEKEILEIFRRNLYFVEVPQDGARKISLDKAASIVASTLPEDVEVTGVTVSSDPKRAWQVNLSKPRRASVQVNQYSGEILGRNERAGFFSFMFKLHRWLLDSMKPDGKIFWGKMIVGYCTIFFIFILISGFVTWWPNTLATMKRRLKIPVKKGWNRFWHTLHTAGGAYAGVFLLLMALTGLTWSFQWYRNGVYKLFGVETPAGHGAPAGMDGRQNSRGGSGSSENSRNGSKRDALGNRGIELERQTGNREIPVEIWQKVYERLAAENPNYNQISVMNGSATITSNKFGNRRASDRYNFDRADGSITGSVLYKDADKSSKMRGWLYSLHVGNWGGMLFRILYFFASMAGATFPITGYWIWLRRRCRKKAACRFHHEVV